MIGLLAFEYDLAQGQRQFLSRKDLSSNCKLNGILQQMKISNQLAALTDVVFTKGRDTMFKFNHSLDKYP